MILYISFEYDTRVSASDDDLEFIQQSTNVIKYIRKRITTINY